MAATPVSYMDINHNWKDSSKSKSGNSSNSRGAFSRKCAHLVKEQRARFYIIRRCVVMLMCWRDYADS